MYIYRISNITVSDLVVLCGLMICMYVRNMNTYVCTCIGNKLL